MLGWTVDVAFPLPKKCIICVAPHTSNWDFIIGELYIRSIGSHSNFLMKREWFFWPLSLLLKRLGGIPVVRSKKVGMTDSLAETVLRSDDFRLAITPEGTRSRVTIWKRGFYHIAQKANLPILLYALDYKKKCIVCTKQIVAFGNNIEQAMKEIMTYYLQFQGKNPEKFSIEEGKA